MLKIYHATGTRSIRPIWLCHELGLPVEVITIDFSTAYRNTQEWRDISPAGKVPILVDDELTMFESGAMNEYILDRYGEGRLRPASGSAESALYLQWCWFSEATLIRPAGLTLLMRADSEDITAEVKEKIATSLDVVDHALAQHPFLLGDEFSAADIMMGYSMALLEKVRLLVDATHAQDYLARLKTRDGFKYASSL